VTEQQGSPNPKPKKKNTRAMIIAIVVVVVVIIAAVVVVVEVTKVPTPTPSKDVEFYTWWATEGKVALDHLGPNFTKATGLTMVPYVSPGAGGSNAIYAILSLIEAGKPPATFQVHYGPAMISYDEAAPNGISSFVSMNSAAYSLNMVNNSFPEVLEAGEFNGLMESMPVNLHQGAQLYFNPTLLKKEGLPEPTNLSLLISDTEALHSKGIYAWIIPGGDGGWDQLNVWEDVFLSLAGGKMYDEFMYGTLNTSNPAVVNLLTETNNIYSLFQNDSYPGEESMTWTEAIPVLTGGTVAFQVNGNWYTNYAYDFLNVTNYPATAPYDNNITVANYTNPYPVTYHGADISLMSMDFPGTSKYFVEVVDSVAVPVGPTQANGMTFAKYFASYAGQLVWTKWKAVTFYNNITTDYFNTPAQWASYQQALADESNASAWVYQLSDGGLASGPLESAETAMSTFSGSFTASSGSAAYSAASSVLIRLMDSVISSENATWQAANSLGLGYMGSPGHPFGNYLPYWANTNANRTSSGPVVPYSLSSVSSGVVYYNLSPISLLYLQNFISAQVSKFSSAW
jgi:glucose/arabinose transport system substrate-binding protein